MEDYQEKVFKNKKKPKILEVDLDKLKSTEAIRPTFIPNFRDQPIYEMTALDIANEFSDRSHHFVLRVLDRILTLSEYSSNNRVAYQLQSGSMTQDLINERNLLNKFESRGMFRNLGEDGIFGIATLSELNIDLIRDVVSHVNDKISGVMSSEEFEQIKENRNRNTDSNKKTDDTKTTKKPAWQTNFKWMGSKFTFGEYGSTGGFNSSIKKKIFSEFVNAKGSWVTIRKLKELTDKGDNYLRPTIGQIEKAFDKELSKFVSIPSTNDDDLEPKPQEGAYRIKFTQKPL